MDIHETSCLDVVGLTSIHIRWDGLEWNLVHFTSIYIHPNTYWLMQIQLYSDKTKMRDQAILFILASACSDHCAMTMRSRARSITNNDTLGKRRTWPRELGATVYKYLGKKYKTMIILKILPHEDFTRLAKSQLIPVVALKNFPSSQVDLLKPASSIAHYQQTTMWRYYAKPQLV